MLLKTIDRKIRDAFTNAAIQYDVLTGMHKEIGRELIEKVKDIASPQYVLDIGMGSGYVTNRLKHYFPTATVIGLDSSSGMVELASKKSEGFKILQADARQLPLKEKSIDLVVSNLALQWVDDLPKVVQGVYSCLKSNGEFAFTMFGHNTFQELFESFDQAKAKSKEFSIRRLYAQKDVEAALKQGGFKDYSFEEEKITAHFPDMLSLIKWIKDIGANQLERNFFVGPDLLERANFFYEKNYRERTGVKVSFQVFWVRTAKSV